MTINQSRGGRGRFTLSLLVWVFALGAVAFGAFLLVQGGAGTAILGAVGRFAYANGTTGRENIFNDTSIERAPGSKYALALDAQDRPHIAWVSLSTGHVYYLFFNGTTWTSHNGTMTEQVDQAVSPNSCYGPSLALDSTGKPTIAYSCGALPNTDVVVRRWNGTAWTGPSGAAEDSIGDPAYADGVPALALANGQPEVVWSQEFGSGNSRVVFRRWNGTAWTGLKDPTFDVLNEGPTANTALSPSIAINQRDQTPYVAWHSQDIYKDVYFKYFDGTNWTGLITPSGDNVSATFDESTNATIAVDDFGFPVIVWQDGEPIGGWTNIHVARWDRSVWAGFLGSTPDVLTSSGLNSQPTVVFSNRGLPSVAWVQVTPTMAIKHLRWNGSAWRGLNGAQADTVNGTATSVSQVSIDLGGTGAPSFTWLQTGPSYLQELFFTRWIPYRLTQ